MRTVLVADYDQETRATVSTILQAKGFNVVLASDARRALTVLDDNPAIALLIADVSLSAEGNVPLVAELRCSPRHRELPIIALGPSTSVSEILQSLELGASRFVSKRSLAEGLGEEVDSVCIN